MTKLTIQKIKKMSSADIARLAGTTTNISMEILLKLDTGIIRPFSWEGRGNFIYPRDLTGRVKLFLSALGLKYHEGNDAPRGGKEGSFIKLRRKSKRVSLLVCQLERNGIKRNRIS